MGSGKNLVFPTKYRLKGFIRGESEGETLIAYGKVSKRRNLRIFLPRQACMPKYGKSLTSFSHRASTIREYMSHFWSNSRNSFGKSAGGPQRSKTGLWAIEKTFFVQKKPLSASSEMMMMSFFFPRKNLFQFSTRCIFEPFPLFFSPPFNYPKKKRL